MNDRTLSWAYRFVAQTPRPAAQVGGGAGGDAHFRRHAIEVGVGHERRHRAGQVAGVGAAAAARPLVAVGRRSVEGVGVARLDGGAPACNSAITERHAS